MAYLSPVVSVVREIVASQPLRQEHLADVDMTIVVSCSTQPRIGPPPDFDALSPFESLPRDLVDLWSAFEAVRLFEDQTYGQWGLVLWGAEKTATGTAQIRTSYPRRLRPGDLVIGEWLGDTDLVVVDVDPQSQTFAHVLVANPLDEREAWCDAAPSLTDFVNDLAAANGEKFWSGRTK